MALLDDPLGEPAETFTLTLSNAAGATIADGTGTGTIADDGDPPPPSVSLLDAQIGEPDPGQLNTRLAFQPKLSRPYSKAIEVEIEITPGTATAGADYLPPSSTSRLHFDAGETIPGGLSGAFEYARVDVLADSLSEPDETVTATITSVIGDATITDGTATGTIKGNLATFGPGTHVGLPNRPVKVTPKGVAPVVVINANPFGVKGGLALTVTAAQARAAKRVTLAKRTFSIGRAGPR